MSEELKSEYVEAIFGEWSTNDYIQFSYEVTKLYNTLDLTLINAVMAEVAEKIKKY